MSSSEKMERRSSQRLSGRPSAAGPSAATDALDEPRAGSKRKVSSAAHGTSNAHAAAAAGGSDDGPAPQNLPGPADAHAEVTVSGVGASKKLKAGGPTRRLEEQLWAKGHEFVAGVDEAGRGPLAGPVVAAACVVPRDVYFDGVNDSKAMTEEEREELYAQLTRHPRVLWAAHVIEHEEIDTINILQAAMKAMREAVRKLPADRVSYILVDGNRVPQDLPAPAQAVVKGDATCFNIAAASIIAKVTRDRIMVEYDKQYPQYGFAQHKAYGVPAHVAAIKQHGPCPIHRRSFEPVKSMVGFSYPKPQGAAASAGGGKKPGSKGGKATTAAD